ncbi:MAG: hypothetical protein R3F61_36080 [Myxococcota bacterium]
MHIDRHTRVMNIVADPELAAVLEWYGLPIQDRTALRLTLENFCSAHDVDVEDLLLELQLGDEGEDEEEDEDWLAMDEEADAF